MRGTCLCQHQFKPVSVHWQSGCSRMVASCTFSEGRETVSWDLSGVARPRVIDWQLTAGHPSFTEHRRQPVFLNHGSLISSLEEDFLSSHAPVARFPADTCAVLGAVADDASSTAGFFHARGIQRKFLFTARRKNSDRPAARRPAHVYSICVQVGQRRSQECAR